MPCYLWRQLKKLSMKNKNNSQKNDKNINKRVCPYCNQLTLNGMPGSVESICKNCGYKDPCCYD